MCVLDKRSTDFDNMLKSNQYYNSPRKCKCTDKKIRGSKLLMSPPLSVGIFMQSPQCAATHMIPTLPVNLEIMLQRINKTKHLFN